MSDSGRRSSVRTLGLNAVDWEDRIDLEESVYLAGNDGPRRAVQLVIHGRARNVMRVQWTFAMSTAPTAAPRRGRGEEPQLPL